MHLTFLGAYLLQKYFYVPSKKYLANFEPRALIKIFTKVSVV